MTHRSRLKYAFITAATLSVAGLISQGLDWLTPDIAHEPVKLLPHSSTATNATEFKKSSVDHLGHYDEAHVTASSASAPSTTASQQACVNNPDALKSLNDKDIIAKAYYDRALNSGSPADRIYNLQWMLEQYGSEVTPDAFAAAAKSLNIPKDTLVNQMKDSAKKLFSEPKPQNFSSKTNELMYWHDLYYAHKYMGLTPNGDVSPSDAVALTRTTEDELKRMRNLYSDEAARELSPYITQAIQSVFATNTSRPKALKDSWDKLLGTLETDHKIELQLCLSIIDYALYDQRDNGDIAEKRNRYNLSPEIIENFYGANDIIQSAIQEDILKHGRKIVEKLRDLPPCTPK